MATVGERLATLEVLARENRAKIDHALDLLEGGGDVEYDRSVRGRLHSIESTLAAYVLRRNLGFGFLKGWERAVLLIVAVATGVKVWIG